MNFHKEDRDVQHFYPTIVNNREVNSLFIYVPFLFMFSLFVDHGDLFVVTWFEIRINTYILVALSTNKGSLG